jgi:hypothetical protein
MRKKPEVPCDYTLYFCKGEYPEYTSSIWSEFKSKTLEEYYSIESQIIDICNSPGKNGLFRGAGFNAIAIFRGEEEIFYGILKKS